MLKITQRYLCCSLTPGRNPRFLTKGKKRNQGSLRKASPKICSINWPKPTKEDSACTPTSTAGPLAPCSVPLLPSARFCGPCSPCNPSCCTPCNQHWCLSCSNWDLSCCNCNPSCCTSNPCCCTCNPSFCTCNSNCYRLFQPCCPSCCVCGSNNKSGRCVPPPPPPAPACLTKVIVRPENHSEIIFKNKGKIVHENRRFSPIGVENPPLVSLKKNQKCPLPLSWQPKQVQLYFI